MNPTLTEAVADSTVDEILLAHGGGGLLTDELIREHFLPRLANRYLDDLDDGAVLGKLRGKLAFTTDSFVVQPLEFPGGDIGRLAVAGTVNDLAMMGAKPIALSVGLILEEGLSLQLLDRIIDSLAATAKEAGVLIATGDTKVIERRTGDGDGLMINTSGIGVICPKADLGSHRVRPGDAVILTGNLAEHGLTVMARREKLRLQSELKSDVAPLNGLIEAILASGVDVKFMRDPTRGGLAGVLADLAAETQYSVEIEEADVPISTTARHAAELLGLDPLTVANEGKCLLVVAPDSEKKVLDACRAHQYGKNTKRIGRVTEESPPLAELLTRCGGRRIIQKPYGEELPRIC